MYAGFGFPGADDLANMFHFKDVCREYFCSARTYGPFETLDLLTLDPS